ncbi:MAG: hypothetical protein WKF91_11605 [Segetibacter sp.]
MTFSTPLAERLPEEFLKNGLGQAPFEAKGALPEKALAFAMEESRKWGIPISFKSLCYFNAGYVTTVYSGHLEIGLKEGMKAEENFHILIHELAHLFLGHTLHTELHYAGKARPTTLPQRRLFTTAKELEAETVSFLVCKKMGLETRSAEYIAGYIKSKRDLSEFDYGLVIKAADKIDRLFVLLA